MNYSWNCSDSRSTTSTEAGGVPGYFTAAIRCWNTSPGKWAEESGLHGDSFEYDRVLKLNKEVYSLEDAASHWHDSCMEWMTPMSVEAGLRPVDQRLLDSAYVLMFRDHALAQAGITDQILLVVDTGCTEHTVNVPRPCMTEFKKCRKRIGVALQGVALTADGVGTLPLHLYTVDDEEVDVDLKQVQLCPLVAANLISMSQAAKQGCTLEVNSEGAIFTVPTRPPCEINVTMIGGLYVIDGRLRNPPSDTLAFSRATRPPVKCVVDGGNEARTARAAKDLKPEELALLVHEAMAHMNWTACRKVIAEEDFMQVLALTRKQYESLQSVHAIHCAACERTKKVKHSQPARGSDPPRKWKLWEIVFADHCGPFPPQAGGGHTHMSAFLEGSRGMCVLFRGRHPTGAATAEKMATVDDLARKVGNGIVYLRSDEGSDFTSRDFKQECQRRGIRHQMTTVDGHGSNKVERLFRTLQENARALLERAGMDIKYMFYAMEYVNFVHNHLKKGGTSPYIETLGSDPCRVQFFPFGCSVTGVSPRRKDTVRNSNEYTLLGYSSQHNGGYLLQKPNGEVVEERH